MNLNKNGQSKLSPTNSFADSENEIKKYLRILKRRKWLIFFTFAVVFAAWVGYVILYDSQPVYTARTLLHFQDARQIGALDAESGRKINESRVTTLTTNKLLGTVVKELQFNLSIRTKGVQRSDVFKYVDASFNSIAGIYKISKDLINQNKFYLYYSNKASNITDKLLTKFVVKDTVRLEKYHLTFQLNKDFFAKNDLPEIEFSIRNVDRAINILRNITSSNWLDRKTNTYLEVSATHPSPVMAAKVANTLAERFVEFDSRVKNRKSTEAMKNLDDQLEIARKQLEVANQKLQSFRERNPGIVEGNFSNSLARTEEEQARIEIKRNEISNLLSQLNQPQNFDEKIITARQLLAYLSSERIPSAMAFETEFKQYTMERIQLQTETLTSPILLRENENKINGLISKVGAKAEEYLKKLDTQIASAANNIDREKGKLSILPRRQRELSDLKRDQQVKRNLYEEILLRYNQAKLTNEVAVGDVFIMDEARVPPLQSKWSIVLGKSLLGIVLGLALGLGLAIVVEFFDKTVQTPEDLQTRLKLPVLGSIPVIHNDDELPDNIKDIKGKRDTKLITLDYSPTLESESYRDLRTKLLFMNRNKRLSSFLMTSLRPSEGKSLTCSNLAITFAQQKISTLLIDADLRRGVLHNVFGNNKKPGLGDFLVSKATVDYDNLNKLIQKTIIPNLHLITTGSPIPNPTEMLGSERMTSLLNLLKSRFGMVILDTAPFQASSDAPILSRNVDGLVVVVRADYTNVEQLEQKLQEYAHIQDNVLGLVLNMVKTDLKKERYQYSYYNY